MDENLLGTRELSPMSEIQLQRELEITPELIPSKLVSCFLCKEDVQLSKLNMKRYV